MQIRRILLNLKAASAGAFARPAALFRFVAAALVAPFVLLTIGGTLSNNLPWYFWIATLVLLLMMISIGFLRFTRGYHDAEEISISPDRR